MKKTIRRLLSMAVVFALVLGLFPSLALHTRAESGQQQLALTALTVDGDYTLDFASGKYSYTVSIPEGHPRVPKLTAEAASEHTVTVTQAVLPENSSGGNGYITVSDDEGNSVEYTVTFTKDAALGFHLQYGDYYTFQPQTNTEIARYESSAPEVISVSAAGVMHAEALSDSAVTVTALDANDTVLETLVVSKVVKAQLNIFLITGQSNAYGTYDVPSDANKSEFTAAQLEKTLKPEPGTVLCTDVSNTGVILKDMYDLSEGRSGFSPALGKTWYELTGEKTLMLQTAVGGSPIEAWMKPEGETRYTYNNAASNFYETTKNALEHTLEKLNAADSCYELNRVYAYWLQGETGMGNTYNPDKNGEGIGGWDLGSKVHILSSEEYYNIFMKNMEYFTDEFHVEFMGVLLARATQGVSSVESLELQLLTDLVPTRAAQYALHNTNGTKITLVSRVCDIARMESYTDTTVEGYGFMGCNNLHYNQIGHNANGVAAATNTYKLLYETDKTATDIEIIKENGRDRFTNGETIEVSAGGTYQTAAMVLPMYTDTPVVTYEVADTTVCTIDKYGLITASEDALGKETTVTYKCEAANLTKTIKVKVAPVSASGTLNDSIGWTLENGVLTITGAGDTPSYALADGSPFAEYAEAVTSVVVGEGITRLGNHLFYYMENIQSVQLPSTLIGINARAFGYCTNFTTLTVPESVTALGLSAFKGSGVTDLYFEGNAPTSISGTKPCEGLTYNIHVPCSNDTWTSAKVTAIGGTATLVEEHDYVDHVCSRCGGRDSVLVAGVALNKSELALSVGGSETLTATVSPETATNKTVIWTSSDETVATVADGMVTALKAGTAIITATSAENSELTAACAVTVESAAMISGTCGDSINWALENGVLTLTGTGETYSYAKGDGSPFYAYKDQITKIVVGEGIEHLRNHIFYNLDGVTEVVLPASLLKIDTRAFNGCSGLKSLTVNSNLSLLGYEALVNSGITDLYFTGDAPTTISGAKPCAGLTYNVHVPCDNTTWTDDKLTAMGGTPTKVLVHTWVQGEYYEECSKCDAVNGVPATDVTLDKSTLTVSVGNTSILTATVAPETATVKTVIWTSSDETVATVASGVVTGLKAGTVTITATSAENSALSASCIVTVEVPSVLSGTCGENITWKLEDGVLTLTGTGETYSYAKGDGSPFYAYKDQITKIVVGEGIEGLRNHIFYNLDKVAEVDLPTTLVKIDARAFNGCSNLKSLTVNSNLSLLGYEALVGSGIADLYFGGDAPATISGTKPCTGLTYNIHVPCNNTTWTADVLTKIGGTPTLVPEHAWSGNTCTVCGANKDIKVTGVTLDKASAEITMSDRLTLTATVSPENAADKSLVWTSSDETIATVSGGVVTPLKGGGSVTITAIAKDGSGVKASCTVTIKEGLGGNCGENAYWSYECGVLTITGTGNLTNFTRNPQTDVVSYPWASVKDEITKVVIGEGITAIKNYGFYKCSALASVELPSTLTEIAYGAFQGTTSLKSISIPAKVTGFGSQVFKDSGLKDITFLGLTPTSYGKNLFEGVTANLYYICGDAVKDFGDGLTWIESHSFTNSDGINKCSRCGTVSGALVTEITLDQTEVKLLVGESIKLTATVAPADAAYPVLEWTSSETAVATVTADGVVTAVDPGSATITVKSCDGSEILAVCRISVRASESGNNDPTTEPSGPQGDTDATVQPTEVPDTTKQPDKNSNGWILWALCGGVVVIAAVLAVLLARKKKSAQEKTAE